VVRVAQWRVANVAYTLHVPRCTFHVAPRCCNVVAHHLIFDKLLRLFADLAAATVAAAAAAAVVAAVANKLIGQLSDRLSRSPSQETSMARLSLAIESIH